MFAPLGTPRERLSLAEKEISRTVQRFNGCGSYGRLPCML